MQHTAWSGTGEPAGATGRVGDAAVRRRSGGATAGRESRPAHRRAARASGRRPEGPARRERYSGYFPSCPASSPSRLRTVATSGCSSGSALFHRPTEAHSDPGFTILPRFPSRGDHDFLTILSPGTVAFSAAYTLFVGSYWGGLGLVPQLSLVTIPPLLLVALTHLAATREPSGYVASLLATVAGIAFAVNLGTLGSLSNLPDSRGPTRSGRLRPAVRLRARGMGVDPWGPSAGPVVERWLRGLRAAAAAGLLALTVPARVPGPADFSIWWRGAGAAPGSTGGPQLPSAYCEALFHIA